jgi:hypothetical protein
VVGPAQPGPCFQQLPQLGLGLLEPAQILQRNRVPRAKFRGAGVAGRDPGHHLVQLGLAKPAELAQGRRVLSPRVERV